MIPTFRLALTNFSSTSPIDDRMITEANLVLEGSPKSYTVKGEGTLDGLEASVDLILGTARARHVGRHRRRSTTDARERLGFSFGEPGHRPGASPR